MNQKFKILCVHYNKLENENNLKNMEIEKMKMKTYEFDENIRFDAR